MVALLAPQLTPRSGEGLLWHKNPGKVRGAGRKCALAVYAYRGLELVTNRETEIQETIIHNYLKMSKLVITF